MTYSDEYLLDQLQNALNALDDAKERIEQLEADVTFWKGEADAGVGRVKILERDVADIRALAMDYKDANTRLEERLKSDRLAQF